MAGTVHETATEWARAGASVTAIEANGTKKPLGSWKDKQTQPLSLEQVDRLFAQGRTGLGIVTGYGGYECLDFDSRSIWTEYRGAAKATGLGRLLSKVASGYSERTPHGYHLLWRCTEPEAVTGNKTLAKVDGKTIIETRGSGGFVIVAPSGGRVHDTGKSYEVVRGSASSVAEITPSERERLLELAASLDRSPPPPTRERLVRTADGTRPGDAYNRSRVAWADILEGWTEVYTTEDDVTHWRRPGKQSGTSATTNKHGSDLLWVFSSNAAPFEQDRSYDKFGAYAVLHHDGDHAAAAKALRVEGYEEEDTERFILVTPRELAEPVPPMRWMVKGAWPEYSHGVYAGKQKSLKSWGATAFAVSVTTGQRYLGSFDVRQQGPVLVFSGEAGRIPFQRRLQRIAASYGLDPADIEIPVYATFDVGSIDSKTFKAALKRYLDMIQPVLVVLDPFYVYHPAGVEAQNLYERGPMLGKLSAEVGHDAGLMVVDHYRKTGSDKLDLDEIQQSGMAQWANSWILQGHREPPDLTAGTFRLNVEHGGRDWGGQRWSVDWECGEFDYEACEPAGDITWTVERSDGPVGDGRRKLDHTQIQEIVLSWMSAHDADTKEATIQAVAAENGIGDKRVRAAFDALDRGGKLRSREGRKPNRSGVVRPAELWEPADSRLRPRSPGT